MPPSRRIWDTSVVIGFLAGEEALRDTCPHIIRQAQAGELEILVSGITQAEAAYLKGRTPEQSEALITEFFSRSYIITVAVDIPVARISRRLMRDHNLKAPDAIHLATLICCTSQSWKPPTLTC